jgi:hypothetical protein
MGMDRKGFFKTLFGGFVAASTVPSLVKAEDNPQPPKDLSLSREVLRIDTSGNIGIGGSGHVGLGTSAPRTKLHVEGIIFHVKNRRLEMAADENGDFKIHWLDVKENESNVSIAIQQPKVDPWKINLKQIN